MPLAYKSHYFAFVAYVILLCHSWHCSPCTVTLSIPWNALSSFFFNTVPIAGLCRFPSLSLFVTIPCNLGVLGTAALSRIISLSFSKMAAGSGFVSKSIYLSSDLTYLMLIISFSTCSTICQYMLFMCFVRGLILNTNVITLVSVFSLNALQITLETCLGIPAFFSLSSYMRWLGLQWALTQRKNFASIVLNAVLVCIFDPLVSTYNVLDFAVALSTWAMSGSQLPQTSASHHSSRDVSFGHSTMPLSLVFIKYLPILKIACLFIACGLAINLAHWCTVYVMSGLVDSSRWLRWPRTCLYSHGISQMYAHIRTCT